MSKNNENHFVFPCNLNNNLESHEQLIALFNILKEHHHDIIIDFSRVTFISANLLAILGASLENTSSKSKMNIIIRNIQEPIKILMRKNDFSKYFKWERLTDTYNSTMKYMIFNATTEDIEKFERYLQIYVFSRKEMPLMSDDFRNCLIDNILEIFNNVIDHAESQNVYVCGQFFPKNNVIAFTIVDIGKSIHENVHDYLTKYDCPMPDNSLKWATKKGNSTKSEANPGGLGLSFLQNFVNANQGSFTIISDSEVFMITQCTESFRKTNSPFGGTIVTIEINLNDRFSYGLGNTVSTESFF